MARIARIVAPGYPHHITQRGNRRQRTFFNESDYSAYIDLMAEWCERCGVEIWGYCLMPNHTHLIARPEKIDSLSSAIGEAHRRYSRMINFREGWRGYLWQGRFSSFVMDEAHLIASIRYIERNPVRAIDFHINNFTALSVGDILIVLSSSLWPCEINYLKIYSENDTEHEKLEQGSR